MLVPVMDIWIVCVSVFERLVTWECEYAYECARRC